MARKEILFNEEDYTREYYLETIEMLKEVKQAIVDSKTAIDYDKMSDAFTQGAKKVDSTIYMDREVVGKKVSEPVRSINKLVSDRLNRLEGV